MRKLHAASRGQALQVLRQQITPAQRNVTRWANSFFSSALKELTGTGRWQGLGGGALVVFMVDS
jgi:hypothetical protein